MLRVLLFVPIKWQSVCVTSPAEAGLFGSIATLPSGNSSCRKYRLIYRSADNKISVIAFVHTSRDLTAFV